jgi:hypothetical protein
LIKCYKIDINLFLKNIILLSNFINSINNYKTGYLYGLDICKAYYHLLPNYNNTTPKAFDIFTLDASFM